MREAQEQETERRPNANDFEKGELIDERQETFNPSSTMLTSEIFSKGVTICVSYMRGGWARCA